VALSSNRAIAQSVELDPGGTQYEFGIGQRVESGRNLGLDVPEEGQGTILSTLLSFGISSETPVQSFSLDAVTALRWSDLPDQGSEFDIGDSIFDLDYGRESANAGLDLGLDFSSYDIGFLRSLRDFVDEDGVIDLPPDFDDLTGDGTRREYALAFQMDFGRQDLVNYFFRFDTLNIDYIDQTNPDLFDESTISATAGIGFLISPRTTASIDFFAEQFDQDDPDETDRRTWEVVFGLSQEINEANRFDVTLGYTDINEQREISGDILESGIIGSVNAERDLPNGNVFFTAESELGTAGRLNRVRVGRSRDVANGSFSANLGVAVTGDGKTEPIGSISYVQEFGEDEVRVFFDRNVVNTTDDVFRDEYILDVGYIFGLGPSSRLGLGATHILGDDTAVDPRTQRTDLNAVYSYELESQWVINTGLNYRVRDEDGLGRAESPLAFFSIGRNFAWRP
jgi:hypothetical protein